MTTTTTRELEAQLGEYMPEVVKIRTVLAAAYNKQQVPAIANSALSVLAKAGHIRWSNRAHRHMLTEQGAKFYRQMRKYGHA